jgi:NADH:ubiquinone oxidoreductase subunit K
MDRNIKIHPLILVSLMISAITMALFAYRTYSLENTGNTAVFMGLAVFCGALAVSGAARNRKTAELNNRKKGQKLES